MAKSEKTMLVEAYRAGLSLRDLTEVTGMSMEGVRLRLKRYGVRMRPRGWDIPRARRMARMRS